MGGRAPGAPPPRSANAAGIKHLTLPYLPHAKVSISILIDSQLIWIIFYLKSKANFLGKILKYHPIKKEGINVKEPLT